MRGAIALIEEVGERPYELDRYLTQLALTGELAQLAAVVVGDLTRCVDANPPTGDARSGRCRAARPCSSGCARRARRPRSARRSVTAIATRRCRSAPTAILDLDAGTLEILEPAVVNVA